MKNTINLILIMFVLTGCIEPYHAKTDSIDSILVVEGIITGGTTQITLSKSVGLDENVWNYNFVNEVNNAVLYVEREDNGAKSPIAKYAGSGIYRIETGELVVDAKYRLVIQLDGEEYQSSYLAPAVSPPLSVTFAPDAYNIYVCVTTSGYEHQPGYYLWSFKEDWEITAIMYNDSVFIGGKTVFNDLYSANNRYYCWRKDSSQILILGTTEKLIENTIREKRIHSFPRTSDRSSVLYRIQVKQNTIHKEGYDFYYNLQKNIEQTGSIFGAIPSEIMGNVRCVTNSDIPVIGYVDVSTTSAGEQYLTSIYYNPANGLYRQCETDTLMNPIPPPPPGSGYIIFVQGGGEALEGGEPPVYISERCVDCTKTGGSKNKPRNWPNDHQ